LIACNNILFFRKILFTIPFGNLPKINLKIALLFIVKNLLLKKDILFEDNACLFPTTIWHIRFEDKISFFLKYRLYRCPKQDY